MERIGDQREFPDRTLHPEHSKQAGGAEDGQAVECVIPERRVLPQRAKRCEHIVHARIFLPERRLNLAQQVLEANRVLPVVGMVAMGGLIQRHARRRVWLEEAANGVACQDTHNALQSRVVVGALAVIAPRLSSGRPHR